jgi:protein SCO1/2
VTELAAVLGVRYREDGANEFDHSNLITLLDSKGAIAFQKAGIGKDLDKTVTKVKELAH